MGMGDLAYACEKFFGALNVMATSAKSRRDRLLIAYSGSAVRANPRSTDEGGDVSSELVARIREFHLRMKAAEPVADEGAVAATVHSMSNAEVRRATEELVAICWAMYQESRWSEGS